MTEPAVLERPPQATPAVASAAPPDAAAAPEAPPHHLHDDPLAQVLAEFTRLQGRARSIDALLAHLPLPPGPLSLDRAAHALQQAGWRAAALQRPLAHLHDALLPAIATSRDGQAWLVVARALTATAEPGYRIVLPGTDGLTAIKPAAELDALHDGRVLVATTDAPAASAPPGAGGHWLWSTLRKLVPYYRAALVAALLSNLLMLVTGLVTSVVFDKVIPNQAMVTLWALATASALSLGFDFVARQLRAWLIDHAGKKADLMMGSQLFHHSLGIRMEHRPTSAGAYAHQLGQVEQVREFFASATLSALSDLPFIVVFVAMTFVVGGPLGWVLMVAIPLLLGISLLIQRSLHSVMRDNMREMGDLHGLLVESVDGIEDLKAAGAQGRFLRRYEQGMAQAAQSSLRSRRMNSWTMSLSAVAQQAITMVMLVWGVYLIDAKIITAGALIASVMFAGRALAPLQSVVQLTVRYQGARAAIRALEKLMSQPLDRDRHRSYVPAQQISGRIALRDVGFAYPAPAGAAAVPVLHQVNLSFVPGEHVAVLGRIGSGKSTILRIMAGLFVPTEGQVEVDGIDLRQLDPADYRLRVGFVAQDPRLFNGTLRENVLLDRPGADPRRLAEVAEVTGLARLIGSHPLGWDLPVGEAGALLSGGQRQLVALARSLITSPPIVLMDEPTSSMDAQSEQSFLAQLDHAARHCTLVMVTHRPAVLSRVSRIIVIDAGRVVLDGPRDEVIQSLSNVPVKPSAAGVSP